jgi:hypothetical protein
MPYILSHLKLACVKFHIKIFLIFALFWPFSGFGQLITKIDTERTQLVYFGGRYTYLTPHVLRSFNNAMDFHQKLWDYNPGKIYIMLNDFQDYGNGGAITMPLNQVFIGIGPYNFAYSIVPSSERFQWLFNHELTHIVMTDKPNQRDKRWRKALFGKVRRDEAYPMSAFWSYVTVPRWYAPRWYQEGIAIFMETWMSGGLGRTVGYYDEMYFRSLVHENSPIHSVVGLETEGTAMDFQVGANSYLYGSRFITYLAREYGVDKLREFFFRSDDSKAFYANQFKQVYNKPVNKAWEEWIEFERNFQQENINRIKEYPLTHFERITTHPLGNVSTYRYNHASEKLYMAINHPGIISQIAEIDSRTGDIRKLAELDSPSLYYSTHLAYDPDSNRVFITEQNYKYRSLVMIDVESGRKETLIPFSRTGDLVFNQTDRSIWGVRLDNGYSTLVKIPEPYEAVTPMFEVPFGRAIFDLDISSDGKYLSASISGISGDQELALFEIAQLEAGNTRYKSLHKLDDNTLTQFKFAPDNKSLIGTSYFTGVSNIWRIGIEDGSFELLSNTETGFFMPYQHMKDSLLVLRFYRDGMKPGRIPIKVLNKANAIHFLGLDVVGGNPEVVEWSLPPPPPIDTSDYKEEPYRPLSEMFLANAWPDIAGYKNTIVAGYRLLWRDPLSLSQVNLFLAGSPWGPYEDKQKLHAHLDWQYWNWKFNANWNKADFYDLFGPTKRSRAGYSLGVAYEKTYSLKDPLRYSYNFGIYHYGDLEVLPQYQNIETPIRDFQAATAGFALSKTRRTLGSVEDEKGYKWSLSGTSYYADDSFYPSIMSSQELGFLIPLLRNTNFWIRNTLGQSFGDKESAMSYFYLGGFRNNYVDWRAPRQYRTSLAFPGEDIDGIAAYNFIKTMGELNLKPIRTRNVGTTWLYPTFIYSSIFGTHLFTDPDQSQLSRHIFNLGFQTDIEVVIFSYMKTTWSAGYAWIFEQDKNPGGQWFLSLKLLGN